MSFSAKAFFLLFLFFAIASVSHDIYVWQNSDGFPFAFAALGWITENYFPAEHKMVVETLGPETFNQILTPILKIPAFFLTSGIAALIFMIDFIMRTIKNLNPGRGKDRDQKLKRYQR